MLLLVSLQPQLMFTRCSLTRQPQNFLHGSSSSLGFCLPGGISGLPRRHWVLFKFCYFLPGCHLSSLGHSL